MDQRQFNVYQVKKNSLKQKLCIRKFSEICLFFVDKLGNQKKNQMSLNNSDEVDEKIIQIKGITLFPDISVRLVLISPNEQFLALIVERGYNNVEAIDCLFKIYDLKTTNEIASGQWISIANSNVFQNEFDRYSTFFFQVVSDMLTIVDLKNKTLTNISIEGIQRYLDIDNKGYIYLLRGSYVYQYSINDKEFDGYSLFDNILELTILPNLPKYALAIKNNSWIILQNILKSKLSKRLRKTGGNKIHNLENYIFVEIFEQREKDEDGYITENMKCLKLGEMRTGKIIRNLDYKFGNNIRIQDYEFESLRPQLIMDQTQATINYDDLKFDLLSGREKKVRFLSEDCIKQTKNGFIGKEGQTLRFVRLN
ncbi:unnamed protein product (macronuclear) [Paramecium tetraurelia]|uniref:Uncharacterized protein n=1 Tax=Paramecium tetraurelia TaxID=5888 RepID=A0DHJ9_PARTE|nr:uncharacterized protein GSPATT00016903001 [Paramecium tetraurelia]CAK82516.1 unnamed protein product [Paramecium tetraurelia]|eukprot:XP_001449913.1 hypothetical protein (macronuclear) [Paramecium tetraurelia strain d4-2]